MFCYISSDDVLLYCFIGLFLFGLITSLSGVQFFVSPKVDLSTIVVILTIIGAILLMFSPLVCFIKIVTSYLLRNF